ncbi:unnamed protein product [Ectocarpus sp. CCAP 1310/34]|nr:unnamed protein product [Ectocarpus sp. CCAP 1310/34]
MQIKGSESQLKPVKDKVRAAVKKQRLRLEEFFQPFDVTRTKKVNETTFVRAMNASGIGLTQEELGLLINRYRLPAGNGLIDYQKFCDQSNKVFTSKHLERTPGKTLIRSLQSTQPAILGAGNPTLTPTEKLRTADVLEEMRRKVRDGSLIVKNLFNQFDLHTRGCVSGEQFLRAISCHGLLSADKEYNNSNGDETAGERLERLLVEEAVARRIEVMDYLSSAVGGEMTGTKHPGVGSGGLCSRERFQQLLRGLWRAHFTDEEAEALADRYRPPVDYASARGREQGREEEASLCPRAKEAKDVENVMLDIRGRISRERITLKPAFKGLLPTDARLCELLTRRYAVSDFRRQTTIHQGFVAYKEFLQDVDAPTKTETQAYIDNFVFGRDQNQPFDAPQKHQGTDGGGGEEEGGKGLTKSSSSILRSAASLTSEALMGRGGVGFNPARDCDAIIRDVRRTTARERVRMMDLFKDFDRLQHGTCTQAQLARVMKTLDHPLSDRELAAVCERYKSNAPRECSPGDGTPLIFYKNLVSDIEAVFTVEELEKKSAVTNVEQAVREARGVDRRLRGESSRLEELTEEEQRMLAKFLRELAMKVALLAAIGASLCALCLFFAFAWLAGASRPRVNKDSLCLPSLFTDYDRFNVGDITEAGMERALGGACLLPPEPIFRTIVKKFREHSRRSSGGEVNYKAFLAAVELAQDPLATPRDLPNATKFRAMRAEGGTESFVPAPGSGSTSQGGEVTCTAMRHCLVLADVRLTSPELAAVDSAFRSTTRPEMIGWRDICKAAVDAYNNIGAATEKNMSLRVGRSVLLHYQLSEILESVTGHKRFMGGGASTVASGGDDSSGTATSSPSGWKEEELLLKIDGEIKARSPNLEARDI